MADEVLRLRIVYETERAASSLTRLNTVQSQSHKGLRTIESGMKSLATTALGIPGPIGKVAEGLLKFGTGGAVTLTVVAGLGLIAGAYKLAKDEAERLGKANDKLADTFGGEFGGERVKLIKDLGEAREQLAKLTQEAENLAPTGGAGGLAGIFQRGRAMLFGPGMAVEQIQAQTAIATATTRILNLENKLTKSLREQTAEREKHVKLLKEELPPELQMGLKALGAFDVGENPFTTPRSTTLNGLDLAQGAGTLFEAPKEREVELTRQQERIVSSFVDGLGAMEMAVEDFLVTGKFAIQQLIDDFLRIAFRAASGQFIDMAVGKVVDAVSHSSAAQRKVAGK